MLGAKVTLVLLLICPPRYADTEEGRRRRCGQNIVALGAGLWIFATILAAPNSRAAAETGDWYIGLTAKPYISEIGRICPLKHLEFVSHDDMYEATNLFRKSLPQESRRRLDAAAGYNPKTYETRGCHELMGVSCEDHKMLEGIYKAGLMPRFVQRLCASFVRCLSRANCSTDAKAKGGLQLDEEVALGLHALEPPKVPGRSPH